MKLEYSDHASFRYGKSDFASQFILDVGFSVQDLRGLRSDEADSMFGLSDSHQDPGIETPTTEAASEASPGSPLRRQSRTRPPAPISPNTTSVESDSKDSRDDHVEQRCFYKEHLQSRNLTVDEDRDCYLVEHLKAGHLTPCNPLTVSSADELVETAPIREEVPVDQVHCLQLANFRDQLLSPRHIRLLKLYPVVSIDPSDDLLESPQLRCEAYQACLDDLTTTGRPLFAAASYVCGDQTPTQRVLCGQEIVQIPQNAYDVLFHLRSKDRPRLVWIDNLCINQDDAREKSHQVGMLHSIYAQAHVVSWLGTGRGIDLHGLSFYLSLLARLFIDEMRVSELGSPRADISHNAKLRLETYLKNQGNTLCHPYSLQALVSVFTAYYFKRVWIAQEIILGKTNVCQLGDQLYPLAVVTAAAEVLSFFNSRQLPPLNPEGVKIDMIGMEDVLFSYLQPALKSLWVHILPELQHDVEVVTSLNEGICSDARDYIYGVASLFQESNGYEIDYTLSEAEVFSDFTIHCLMKDQSIALLNQDRSSMGSMYAHPNLRSDLPSWCPDWSVAGRWNEVLFDDKDFEYDTWQACGTKKFVCTRPSRTTLALKGLEVSRIKLCADTVFKWVEAGRDQEGRQRSLVWFEHSANLRTFFKLQGTQLDHSAKDTILEIFERARGPDAGMPRHCHNAGLSRETKTLFDRHDFVALIAPVYLAAVDPELFEVTGMQINASLPVADYPVIRDEVAQMLIRHNKGARLFVTEDGMQSTGYAGIQQGDLVCIIYGSKTPQVLRRVDGDADERYILVGACNVDGLMHGEGLEMGLTEQEFILV